MKTIYKYPVAPNTIIEIPKGAEILTIQTQNNTPCLWALVNPEETELTIWDIKVYGTGHPVPDNPGEYLGTFQLDGGALVFHVFCGE